MKLLGCLCGIWTQRVKEREGDDMEHMFVWKNEYSVGALEIDEQHKQLLNLGNTIAHATIGEVLQCVVELHKYTKVHFSSEEQHMRELGFPDLEAHMELHQKLIDDLYGVVEKGFTETKDIDGFKTFLYEWLNDHLLTQDRKYFDYARTLEVEKTREQ